jgi:hypothetical protein
VEPVGAAVGRGALGGGEGVGWRVHASASKRTVGCPVLSSQARRSSWPKI